MKLVEYNINDERVSNEMFLKAFQRLPYVNANKNRIDKKITDFETNTEISPKALSDFRFINQEELIDPELELSEFGTPLLYPVELSSANFNNGQVLRLPNSPMVEVTGNKLVIKTAVAGSDFSIKEIVSANDYNITIKGFATQTVSRTTEGSLINQTYPETILKSIINLYRFNEAVDVNCRYLAHFGIYRLVIEEVNFPVVQGAETWFPYELRCVNDVDFQLELLQ